ncbi:MULTISPECIES: VWA domain-containing protein [unclassified Bradyrhizobium]|uniref:nitric oxide reductase activation protein NorD n=1 Tax=unclassified Bradyrhizobium TaxID=2631580 RepID=UPI001FFAFD81|nr:MULTISPECIES: VWA domain-containing protein [unclassified Bradyrhizobium]MCK1302626.1 VWA domain-containing protein [Bradyrhizobium sp. 37]MCK1774810.1 VWA domain-containing protein [Bradyrhizobium sp. 134]
MLDFLELEETVGRAWHRMVGGTASYPVHDDHAVALAEVRGRLAVMFRALGGETGVQIASAGARRAGHRLGWRQRIGLGDERLEQPGRDAATVFLPDRIAIFADRGLNACLYRWLAAWFAVAPMETITEYDPLRRDLLVLRRASETAVFVLTQFPGLAADYAQLAAAMAEARPRRPLPRIEQEIEQVALALLGAGKAPSGRLWPAMMGTGPLPEKSPPGYRSVLPCPLWGDCWTRELSPSHAGDDACAPGAGAAAQDNRKRFAVRERENNANRRDPFVLNRFEKILAMAEMVNVDRPADDSEDEDARKAADDLEEITLSRRSGKPASRLKFDLDLPPEALDASPLNADLTYPEWDYRSSSYLPDHCHVLAGAASETGETWSPDESMRRHIRQVRRRFEILRPRRELMRAQADGHDLDLDALVRARCDLRAGSSGGFDRIHVAMRPQGHDLAVTLLVDVSLSTDAWVEGHRVLDVEKEALLVLAHGLSACGDHHSILTFTSRRRSWVRLETVKAFGEPMSGAVERRIGALKPGYYTRIGAAVRHASAELARQPQRKKLLLVLTDGKPNDVDHYEGRFAVEDTRKSVQEARRLGIAAFGVTVDATAQSYFPTLFGRGGYAIVGNIRRLPAALPAIYRQVAH